MATLLSYALVSVEDVKESLGIDSGDNSKDNLIVRKINQATQMIERATGVRFAETTYTNEEYDATGVDQLVLKQRPITTFTSFDGRDTALNENDWTTIDTELYFVDTAAGVIDLLFRAVGRWNRYRVTYTAGFDPIPQDISEAAATLASYYVDNPTSGAAVKSKQEGQRRIEYYDTQSNSAKVNQSIFNQLGIDEIIMSYSDYPIQPDK
jgi:hypothetical protein